MKSLVRGLGMKSPTSPCAKRRKNKNRRGAVRRQLRFRYSIKRVSAITAETLSICTGISIVTSGMGNSHSRGTAAPCDFLPSAPLRFLLYSLCFAHGNVRAAALKPAWGHCPQTPSSLRDCFKPASAHPPARRSARGCLRSGRKRSSRSSR